MSAPRDNGTLADMTVDRVPESIRAMAEAIRVAADPQRILLFGSQARGEARADSDVDLLVVLERERWAHASTYEEMSRLHAMIPRPNVAVDVLVFTPEEVEDYRTARNSVVARALKDGVVLYERR